MLARDRRMCAYVFLKKKKKKKENRKKQYSDSTNSFKVMKSEENPS
jgi:hypothetical protein